MKLFAALNRLLRILFVIIRYRLDDIVYALPLPWYLRATRYVLPWRWLPRPSKTLPRGARLRLALEGPRPVFIQFVQSLSTRRVRMP